MTAAPPEPPPRSGTKSGLIVVLCVLAGVAGFSAWLYGKRSPSGNTQDVAACRGAAETARRIGPLAKGEVAALQVPASPKPAVEVSFNSPEGKPLKLSDFRGRTILLNLWATWCAPCRHEMPALDRLQKTLGSETFEVVAVNIDTTRLERPKQFLAEVSVEKLAYYHDASAAIFQDLKRAGKAFGMPTTLLIDPQGCEIGNLAGPAEWSSEDAFALIRAALATR
jgi:thiol-disulfide isomerase/thioredoxin